MAIPNRFKLSTIISIVYGWRYKVSAKTFMRIDIAIVSFAIPLAFLFITSPLSSITLDY